MGFKRTLTNIVGSALIAGSTLIGSCQLSHAQKTESYEPTHTIQLSPQKTRDSKEIPVQLFQYQQHNQKLVSMGKTILPIEAEMDYESGQILISYSSGRMTDDGPDLSKFSKKERRSLQGTQLVPRLNDSHTLAVVVSSCPEGVDIKYEGQMGWLMGAKENPVSLIPSEKKLSHQLFLYAGNEGIDKLVDLGAKKISYGLTDGWDELIDQIGASDKYKVDASGRARRFLEGLRDKERARQERHAESSLEKGVSMGILDLHNDPKPGLVGRHMVARSIDLTLENNTFEDQEFALYFNQIRIGQKASQDEMIGTSAGSKFGDVRDIEVRVKLPKKRTLNDLYGHWEGIARGKKMEMHVLKEPTFLWIRSGFINSKMSGRTYWHNYSAKLNKESQIDLALKRFIDGGESSAIIKSLTSDGMTMLQKNVVYSPEINVDFSRPLERFSNTPSFFSTNLPPLDLSGKWKFRGLGGFTALTDFPGDYGDLSRDFYFEEGSEIALPLMGKIYKHSEEIIKIVPQFDLNLFLLKAIPSKSKNVQKSSSFFVRGLKDEPQKLFVTWGYPLSNLKIREGFSREEIVKHICNFAGERFAESHVIYERVGGTSKKGGQKNIPIHTRVSKLTLPDYLGNWKPVAFVRDGETNSASKFLESEGVTDVFYSIREDRIEVFTDSRKEDLRRVTKIVPLDENTMSFSLDDAQIAILRKTLEGKLRSISVPSESYLENYDFNEIFQKDGMILERKR